MNWLYYLLEANLYLAVFYAGYYLFLSRETHYVLNRVYLLFGSVVSFVLTIIQLGTLKPVVQPIAAMHYTYPVSATPITPVYITPAPASVFNWDNGLIYLYLSGAA